MDERTWIVDKKLSTRGFNSRHLHHSTRPFLSAMSSRPNGGACSWQAMKKATNALSLPKGNMFYLYILRCNDDSLYVGITNNLDERIARHNKGEGALYTARRLPSHLVYSEKFSSLKDARTREQQIKKWRRQKKENLIQFGKP